MVSFEAIIFLTKFVQLGDEFDVFLANMNDE